MRRRFAASTDITRTFNTCGVDDGAQIFDGQDTAHQLLPIASANKHEDGTSNKETATLTLHT